MNQRVVSTTITFDPSSGRDMLLTPVFIDGIEVKQEYSTPIERIEVSRVIKYQEKNEMVAPGQTLTRSQQHMIELINQSHDHPQIKQLKGKQNNVHFDYKYAFKAA